MEKPWSEMTQDEKQAHNQAVMRGICRPYKPADLQELSEKYDWGHPSGKETLCL